MSNSSPPAPSCRDRRTRLILFGAFEVLLGLSSLLLGGLVMFSMSRIAGMAATQETGGWRFRRHSFDMAVRQGWLSTNFMLWLCVIWVALVLAYLLWVKRYFHATA